MKDTLQLVLDATPESIYVIDKNTYELIFANNALRQNFDYDIVGRKCWEALTPFSGPCPYCKVQEAGKLPLGVPYVWDNYNAEMKMWLHITNSNIRWIDGRDVQLLTFYDITPVKENEVRLSHYKEELEKLLEQKSKSESALKLMGDNLPNSFIFQLSYDSQGNPFFPYMTKGVYNLCGITAEEIMKDGSGFLSLVDDQTRQTVRDNFKAGTFFRHETCLQMSGGVPDRWVALSGISRIHEDGSKIMDCIGVDVSERKRMEADLLRSQQEALHNAQMLREIGDNMPDTAMYRTHIEADGHIRLDYATSQIEKIIGVPLDELYVSLKGFLDHIHPEDAPHVIPRIQSTTAMDTPETTVFRFLTDEGQVRWIRLQSKGLIDERGQVVRDGMLIDITAQKNLELELVAARDMAEASDKLKSTFLANMSHEIRTPMNAIIGFLDFLSQEDDIAPEQQKEYMRIVTDNAHQLLNLIGDILDISKIDAGQMRIVPIETDVNGLLRDICTSFHATGTLTASGKKIDLLVDESLSDGIGCFTIDGARIRQVISNLVGNAIKFTDRGHVKYGYSVVPELGLRFYVEDTGIGIPPENIKDLGKPFRQVHDPNASAKYGGTGIGLAISMNLVRLMGGTFDITSELGKGSRFEFTVPCLELCSEQPRTFPMTSFQPEDLRTSFPGRTILIVEDMDASMGYLCSLLRHCDVELLTVSDGASAVEMVRTHHEIDMVLMDVRMPGMDGLIATRRIKELRPTLPVVGQTAFVSSEDQLKMAAAGFDDFVPKPVNRLELFGKIGKFLD